MMKVGDRVKLQSEVADKLMQTAGRHFINWHKRKGTIHHHRRFNDMVEVLWDDRRSLDTWSESKLEYVD